LKSHNITDLNDTKRNNISDLDLVIKKIGQNQELLRNIPNY